MQKKLSAHNNVDHKKYLKISRFLTYSTMHSSTLFPYTLENINCNIDFQTLKKSNFLLYSFTTDRKKLSLNHQMLVSPQS